ncbi:MAG: phosphatase domain-containing protein [Trueperaceae bacterium]
MADLGSHVGGWIEGLRALWAAVRRRFRRRGPRVPTRPVTVVPYLGYGVPSRIVLRGRVLEGDVARRAGEGDGPLQNLRNAYLRFETDELPGAAVEVSLARRASVAVTVVTDAEGYFRAELTPEPPAAVEGGAVPLRIRLLEPSVPAGGAIDVTGSAMVAGPAKRFVLLSDIDDTVLVTQATRPWRVVRDAMFGNALTRRAFAGVAALYRAFEGAGALVSYVSSAPWNIYDLLQEFLVLNDIPAGPMVLRDWGFGPGGGLPTRHMHHKVREAEDLLDAFPPLPFVLLGDSGQEDPEIYAELAKRHPERIALALIRDVGANEARKQEIARQSEAAAEAGVPLVLVPDSVAAAAEAARHGWLPDAGVEDVRFAMEEAVRS